MSENHTGRPRGFVPPPVRVPPASVSTSPSYDEAPQTYHHPYPPQMQPNPYYAGQPRSLSPHPGSGGVYQQDPPPPYTPSIQANPYQQQIRPVPGAYPQHQQQLPHPSLAQPYQQSAFFSEQSPGSLTPALPYEISHGVFLPTEYDDGARFDIASQNLPPPPPGILPTSSQVAAAQGLAPLQQPIRRKRNKAKDFFTGGSGAGYTFW